MAIEVTYYASACVGIRTEELSILCDPWFTGGAYDGAWFLYPPIEDPLKLIPRYDFIYISHLHPDHYDPVFLRSYLARFPDCRILIADFKHNYLHKLMLRDKIPHEIRRLLLLGATDVHLIPHGEGRNDFDSILVVKRLQDSVVNWNDNFYNLNLINKVKEIAPYPTIALLPYTGAGPYPQTYFEDELTLKEKAAEQKNVFILRYLKLAFALRAQMNIPFAGSYVLGGSLAALNPFRGVSDATEILSIDSTAVVLETGAYVSTKDLKPSAVRALPYSEKDQSEYTYSLRAKPMDYEIIFEKLPLESIPFEKLFHLAFQNAIKYSEIDGGYNFIFHYGAKDPFIVFTNGDPAERYPTSEITVNQRYLFGLLTGVFHWNNAETGSHLKVKRSGPYNREAQDFLNFFHV